MSARQPEPGRDVEQFNARAERYDEDFVGRHYHRPVQLELVRLATRDAPPPQAIPDVGCGTGSVLALFAGRYPEARLCGVDPATEMLRVARGRLGTGSRAELLEGGAERLPFDDATFDVVVSSNSFHHWADQAAGIREIGRVLARGGRLVMTDPFAIGFRRLRARLRPHGRMRTKGEVEAMLRAAGLEVRGWEHLGLLGPIGADYVAAAAATSHAPGDADPARIGQARDRRS